MTLIESLHEAFLYSGEILPSSDIARLIQEHEFDTGMEYDAATILRATREAGERFVDSMQENEHDTEDEVRDGLYCGYPIEPLEERLKHWEVMRPSVVRRAELEVIAAQAAVVTTTTTIMLYAHYTTGKQPTVRITPQVRPVEGTLYSVKGKREANALARQHNAKPWNF